MQCNIVCISIPCSGYWPRNKTLQIPVDTVTASHLWTKGEKRSPARRKTGDRVISRKSFLSSDFSFCFCTLRSIQLSWGKEELNGIILPVNIFVVMTLPLAESFRTSQLIASSPVIPFNNLYKLLVSQWLSSKSKCRGHIVVTPTEIS